MKTNITLIGVNFYPEDTAIGLYSTQMAEHLAKTSHVEVITGFPYYPEWEIREDYRQKSTYLTEIKENVTIYRYKQYVPKEPTFKSRVLHMLDFTLGSVRNVFKVKKSDLVICVVPFTSSVALGLFLAKLRGAKVWVHIQDFEFDAAVESGIAGQQKGLQAKIFKGLFWLEKKLLDKADIVSTISYGMIEKLKTKTSTQTYFFPNWVDEAFIDPERTNIHEHLKSDKFKILYSGSIGAKQDWDFFLKVVEHFKDSEEMEFVVVGAGAKKEWLVRSTQEYANVIHHDPVAYEELPDLLCSADLHVLFQKSDVVDTVMPSKLLGMMASAKPSLVTGNLASEVAKVFHASGGGAYYESAELEKCMAYIQTVKENRSEAETTGHNARGYVIDHFSSVAVLNDFQACVDKNVAQI